MQRNWIAVALAALAACTTGKADKAAEEARPAGPEPAPVAQPWTGEFQQKGILIADEVSIEGPQGLRDHVAIKQLPGQKYEVETTAEGFLQEVSVGADAANPIWLQLDNLAINAVTRARVLERLDDGPVRIRARGRVTWKNLETGASTETEVFELVGRMPR